MQGCELAHSGSIEVGVSSLGGMSVVKDGKVSKGLKGLEKKLTGKRTPFAAYLLAHFDAFSAVIGRLGAHWDEIAEWAISEGYGGGGNKDELTPDAARKAYEREKKRRTAAPKPPPKAVTPSNHPTPRKTAPDVRMLPQPKEPPAPSPSRLSEVLKDMSDSQPWMKPKRRPDKDG